MAYAISIQSRVSKVPFFCCCALNQQFYRNHERNVTSGGRTHDWWCRIVTLTTTTVSPEQPRYPSSPSKRFRERTGPRCSDTHNYTALHPSLAGLPTPYLSLHQPHLTSNFSAQIFPELSSSAPSAATGRLTECSRPAQRPYTAPSRDSKSRKAERERDGHETISRGSVTPPWCYLASAGRRQLCTFCSFDVANLPLRRRKCFTCDPSLPPILSDILSTLLPRSSSL